MCGSNLPRVMYRNMAFFTRFDQKKLSACFARVRTIHHEVRYLNLKFQASSSFLCLYRPVCVGPVRKPHCWFSHEAAHMYKLYQICIASALINEPRLDKNGINAYAKTKPQISFAVTVKLISAFVFATCIVQSLFPKISSF